MKLSTIKIALVAALFFAMLGLVGKMDRVHEEQNASKYCEMVKIWKETNGKFGWPAYNGEEICK